jgi:PIN domain nuclease of toxin-antitoxin system
MAGGLPMNPTYLLTTCALLAIHDGGAAFSKEVRILLEAPDSQVFVSAISAFEIGQKLAAGMLALPSELARWFPAILKQHYLTDLPLTAAICITATALPPIHKDPFDRLIIATAMIHKLTIITCDTTIAAYPCIKTLW